MDIDELLEQWENGNRVSVAETLIGDTKTNTHEGMLRLVDFMQVVDSRDVHVLRKLIANRSEK